MKDIKKIFINIISYILVFGLSTIISIIIISKNLIVDKDLSDISQLVDNTVVKVRFLGVLMQEAIINISKDGVIELTNKSYPIYYIMPFITALIITLIFIVISKVIKNISKEKVI